MVAVLGRELSRPELSADGPSAGWSAETRTLVRDTVERVVIQTPDNPNSATPELAHALATKSASLHSADWAAAKELDDQRKLADAARRSGQARRNEAGRQGHSPL